MNSKSSKLSSQKLQPGEPRALILRKIAVRAATLCFTVDQFQPCEDYLIEAVRISSENRLQLTPQIYCDLACCYWEMGNDSDARDQHEELRKCTLSIAQNFPFARSKYLYTLEALVINDSSLTGIHAKYLLSFRVNRSHPKRIEGEGLDDPDKIPRKLTDFYIEAQLEHTEKNKPALVVTQTVTGYKFEIESDRLPAAEPNRWYEVTILIYQDNTKAVKLGAHHQMAYTLAYRDKLILS